MDLHVSAHIYINFASTVSVVVVAEGTYKHQRPWLEVL